MKFPLSQYTVYTTLFCYMAVIDNCECFEAQSQVFLDMLAVIQEILYVYEKRCFATLSVKSQIEALYSVT
jgi:hypothetical protein